MEKGYFAAAWGDVTRSPGWVSKLLRLGLLLCVPVFGVLVLYGYLYGWARDIAWNVHRPLPERIFGNEDGNLYKRGFFIMVISFVFSLAPVILNSIAGLASGVSLLGIGVGAYSASESVVTSASGGLLVGFLLNMVAFVLSFAVCFFAWIGTMRSAIYGTLSAGFQLGKIWAMLRYDFFGILRIFGMVLLCGLVIGVVAFVLIFVFVFVGAFVAYALSANDASVALYMLLIFVVMVIAILACLFVSVLVSALTARALGYWTRQFEVHLWGGQEDPMPFERRAMAGQAQQSNPAAQQPYGQQAYYQQPVSQPGVGQQYQQYQQPYPYAAPGEQGVPATAYQQPAAVSSDAYVAAQPVAEPTPASTAEASASSVSEPPVIDVAPASSSATEVEPIAQDDGAGVDHADAATDAPAPSEGGEESGDQPRS